MSRASSVDFPRDEAKNRPMGFLLKQFFSFVKLLNSDTGTNQLAAGVAAGFVLGMTPAFSLQSLIIFLCIFLFRIQVTAAFLAAFFFAFPAYLLDSVFHRVGTWALEAPALQELWTQLYNMPIVPLTRFNNTIVMGSGIVALALLPFVMVIARIMILRYRATVVSQFKSSKFFKAFKATVIYKWYYTYDKLYG